MICAGGCGSTVPDDAPRAGWRVKWMRTPAGSVRSRICPTCRAALRETVAARKRRAKIEENATALAELEADPDLGRLPAKTLAARHGLRPERVKEARDKLGIPPPTRKSRAIDWNKYRTTLCPDPTTTP